MEDILASIRRILNEDEAGPPQELPEAGAPRKEDVFVLDPSMIVEEMNPEPARRPGRTCPAVAGPAGIAAGIPSRNPSPGCPASSPRRPPRPRPPP